MKTLDMEMSVKGTYCQLHVTDCFLIINMKHNDLKYHSKIKKKIAKKKGIEKKINPS